MEILTDKALFEKVQNGQIETLGLIYERYKKILFAYFFRMTNDSGWSEDLVQNVFYRMLKYKKQFKGTGSFKSWMFTIARNTLTDGFRKKKNYKLSTIENHQDAFVEKQSADHRVTSQEDHNLLRNALAKLDHNTRELVIMIKLNEMKYREVSEIMGINESTIKVKVFRGIRQLQGIYAALPRTY